MWGRGSAPRRLAESAGFTWKNVGDQSELNVAMMAAHGLEQLHTAEEIQAVLGPRCLVMREAVEKFWTTVAEWRQGAGEPLRSNVDILSVENGQLRATMWTSNSSLGDGTRVGTAEAVLYEKAGGTPIPGYRELFA